MSEFNEGNPNNSYTDQEDTIEVEIEGAADTKPTSAINENPTIRSQTVTEATAPTFPDDTTMQEAMKKGALKPDDIDILASVQNPNRPIDKEAARVAQENAAKKDANRQQLEANKQRLKELGIRKEEHKSPKDVMDSDAANTGPMPPVDG